MFDLPFKLPVDWEVKTVEQLIKEKIIEKPLDGNHGGIHPKATDYVKKGVPFIMASDLEAGRVNLNSCNFITELQASSLRKGFSIVGDVLISHKATIGRTAIVQNNEHEFIVLTPQVTYYRVKDATKLSNIYLKAYFDSNYFQSLLAQWAGSGSTRAYLGITDQLKLPVIIPPITSQLLIANHVEAINSKIELNRQTNQTLEQIAQTLFKSWFVDFEPVRAKMAARQAGASAEQIEQAALYTISGKTPEQLAELDPQTLHLIKSAAALFPDTLMGSEFGEIPEGWDILRFSQIVEKYIDNRGKTPPIVDSGIPLLEVKHLPDHSIKPNINTDKFVDAETYENWFRAHLNSEDLIISTVGTIGRLCMVPNGIKIAIAQNLLGLRFNREIASPYFMYYLMDEKRFRDDVNNRLVITVQASIKRQDLETIDLLSPPIALQNEFERFVKPFVEMQQSDQTLKLSQLRDSLLPKLLSGELL